MQTIDEARLETDLAYRFGYLAEFMGFGAEDIDAIHAAAPALAPLVPALVDAVYDKLHGYDATWRHFVPRQHGYEGPVPTQPGGADAWTTRMIQFRKQHLGRYLGVLVTQALRRQDGRVPRHGRQDAHAEGRLAANSTCRWCR